MGIDAASSVLFTELKNGQDSWFLALPLGASAVKQHALQTGHLPSHNGIEKWQTVFNFLSEPLLVACNPHLYIGKWVHWLEVVQVCFSAECFGW